jgi:Tfp pilus assembly protein PilV
VFARVRAEQGFGLIELLIAMVVLNIGILAIVAAFDSGIIAVQRSSRISTAAALADAQMELYRGLPYASVSLTASTIPAVAPYSTDPAAAAVPVTATCAATADACNASRSVTGPDHKGYRVDTYIAMSTASTEPATPTGGRPLKIVTVVVRDAGNLTASPLSRVVSTFDASTG